MVLQALADIFSSKALIGVKSWQGGGGLNLLTERKTLSISAMATSSRKWISYCLPQILSETIVSGKH
jgi:hypothetical protein